MPAIIPLLGKELCFWCIEAFRECHIHDNSKVIWNDVAVKSYSDESDGFRIVDTKELINVERSVQYTENGKFFLPPNGSSLPISSNFSFEKCIERPEVPIHNEVQILKKEMKSDPFKAPKPPKPPKETNKIKKRIAYSKVHENAIKTIALEYRKGKKCDKSQKIYLCDVCEFSFTLRHNLQSHLVLFHGKTENVSEEKVSALKEEYRRKKSLEAR